MVLSLSAVQATIARALAAGIHDPNRIERAATLIALGYVEQLDALTFTVRSQADQSVSYTVTPEGCECQDAARHPLKRCKHDIAVRILLSAERDAARARELAIHSCATADSVAVAYASVHRRAA
jgi:hypothetical protein